MSAIPKPNQIVEIANQDSRLAAYVELTKLRISVMVLVTFVVAAVLAAGGNLSVPVLFSAMIGMLAVAASGNAMNMYVERYSDFLMKRTQHRPLPDQRLSATEVATFGAISFGIGVAFLFTAVNWQTAVCGIANWILYVFIYTPMKRQTWFNTEVGAIAGAMPVIMGCLAATASVNLVGWSLFAVLVLWQFPHFMAIAWMYRDDYRRGGLQMLTVVDPTGRRAGRKAVVTAALIMLVSLIPVLTFRTPVHGAIFAILATGLGAWYLKAAINFARTLSDGIARKLLRVSLVYLPCYMLILLIASLI
jgi:protoheme IX farnesyltransferase